MRRPKGFVTRQAKRLSDGEINRRRFVMSALSAGVTMPTAMSLASRAEAHVPKPGGHFRMAVAEETSLSDLTAFARGNALTEVTATGGISGELATAVDTPDGGTTWEITLRGGVKFHDGMELSSGHVTDTLDRQRRQDGLLSDITDLRSTADSITLTLDRPDAGFARRLADPRLTVLRETGDGPIGTGPYRPTGENAEGGRIFQRNPDYWKPGRAHFETVTIRAMPDTAARQRAVLASDIDYADMIDPPALGLLQRVPTLEILEISGARHLALTTREAGRALEYVVPERALLEQVLLGHGAAAGREHAPGKARSLLGSTFSPLRIALRDRHLPGVEHAAALIADEAGKAGIPIEIAGSAQAHAEIGWSRTPDGSSCIAVWANDLAAHARTLAHAPGIGVELANDGARITERWWYA